MRRSIGDRAFVVIDYAALALALVVVILPLLNVISQSFSSPDEVIAGRVFLWPVGFTLEAYWHVVRQPTIMNGFLNSVIYATIGTCLNIALTVMAAYPLSRRDFYGRGAFMFFFTFTMLFGGGMIPTYLVVRSLGLIDTRFAMIIPSALAVWNLIIARTFFQTNIPVEMYESAELDGASDIRTLVRIVLPLSAPIVAVLVLFYAVGHWNSYFDALLYLKSSRLFNLQVVLRDALQNVTILQSMIDVTAESMRMQALVETMKYAIIMIAILPVLILYPFVQKYFIRGIMLGSLKG